MTTAVESFACIFTKIQTPCLCSQFKDTESSNKTPLLRAFGETALERNYNMCGNLCKQNERALLGARGLMAHPAAPLCPMLRALPHFELCTSRLATGSVPSSLGLGASSEMALSLDRVRCRSTDTRLATRDTWLSEAHLRGEQKNMTRKKNRIESGNRPDLRTPRARRRARAWVDTHTAGLVRARFDRAQTLSRRKRERETMCQPVRGVCAC